RLCLAATGMAGGWGGNNYSSLPAKASRTGKVDRDGLSESSISSDGAAAATLPARRGAMADTATMAEVPAGAGEADDPARRPVVTLLLGGHRRAEAGHPWIFSNEIAMDTAAKALAPGTLVTLR